MLNKIYAAKWVGANLKYRPPCKKKIILPLINKSFIQNLRNILNPK